jgi:hypothetical protein
MSVFWLVKLDIFNTKTTDINLSTVKLKLHEGIPRSLYVGRKNVISMPTFLRKGSEGNRYTADISPVVNRHTREPLTHKQGQTTTTRSPSTSS